MSGTSHFVNHETHKKTFSKHTPEKLEALLATVSQSQAESFEKQ